MKTILVPLAALAIGGCAPTAPTHPTWADVEPILRGNCTQCHGATAKTNAHVGDQVYRFDFFEMSAANCGAAAQALGADEAMAHGWAPLIKEAVTPPATGGRARMPPAPAPALADWERETLVRWADDPIFGAPPAGDRRPVIDVTNTLPGVADRELRLTAIASDPDGESVVGLLRLGDVTLELAGPGAYAVDVDTSAWTAGKYPASAELCDGWAGVIYELPEITVLH